VPAIDSSPHGIDLDAPTGATAEKKKPIFSVQHHPEASPGPTDSLYLFDRFAELMGDR